ncbi:MAG: tetratricopeptide repeat protein [Myxococcales bacterium]|nr:tetratricopeptide repeat protein [Myxococcales bacterium]
MKILERRIYRGPNLYAHFPVIRLKVDLGALEHWPSAKIPGFVDRLLEAIPTLDHHTCSYSTSGGFVRRLREDEGTWLGHVLEHVAIELQVLAGARVSFGKTRGSGAEGEYFVVFEYEEEQVGEAAELALDLLKDAPRTREILVSLRERAGALWSRGVATSGEVAAPTAVEMALRNLADLHQRAGEKREAIDLLRGGANLPFETETSLGMRRKAAALAVEVGERQQAIALYSAVVDAAPDDLDTVRHLAALIEAEERYPELLVLRQHELARTDDPARRLDLRLDLAKIVGILEVRGGRVEALKANLDEDPSHDASLAAISSVLSEKGDFGHLADFLTGHAGRLEGIGDRARAARLWSQVAGLAEDRLADVRRAIDAHDHVVALEDDIASLDALARLHTGLGEAAEAIPALTRRLALTQGAERSSIVMQLAQAHVSASQIDAAIGVLADACAAEPAIAATRELLADLYRTIGAWQPLADHLLRASDYVSDAAAKLGFLREAAEIYATRLGTLDQAVPVFERICKLDPSDRETRLVWVDALLAAGRLDEARELLEQQIREFGRRRSLERAGLHFRLARVLREQGRPNEAMAQLDQAAPMAPAHLGILRMLAELAYEAGESARAERAFRALLLAIRRHPQDDEAVGVAEVQYELSRLAAARGQEIQARELYESAYATAMQGGIEARKLQRALKAHGDHDHLAGLLEVRLKEVEEPSERAEVLAELANLRELEGKSDEAFEIRLKALQDAPGSAALHTAARDQAIRAGLSLRYVEVLRTLVERHRRRDEAPLAADLWLRLAELTETELKDLDQANECFAKAEATGERQVEAWIGLARIAAIRGDHQRQAELFEKIAAPLEFREAGEGPRAPTSDVFGARIGAALQAWSRASPRPLVLFLDEIDALAGSVLISILRQLRDGYPERPADFPWSLALVGLRDVRDYLAAPPGSEDDRAGRHLGTASPFNIKVRSLTLRNFTADEVAELYAQHSADTGQRFEPAAIARAHELSDGQPWLVNALAKEAVEELVPEPTRPITAADIDAARDELIRRQDTHLDSLTERLRETRVRQIIEPILAGDALPAVPEDDLRYVLDLGLVRYSEHGGLVVANPIYREAIPRALATIPSASLPQLRPTWLGDDGRLDPRRLRDAFLAFWRQHGEPLLGSAPYHEIAPHLVLMAFLHRVANGGGSLEREYAIGSGRMDLLLTYRGDRLAIELKVWRDGEADPRSEGLDQLDRYLAGLGLESGWLVIFDRRSGQPRIAARTGFEEATTPAGRRVVVVRA